MHRVFRNSSYVSQQLQGAGHLNEVMKKDSGAEYEWRNPRTTDSVGGAGEQSRHGLVNQ